MEVNIFVLFITAISFYIILKQLLHRRGGKRLPPGPAGLPLLGSLPHLGPRPHQTLAAWAKLYGPLMAVRFGVKTTIVASSPELAKEILIKQDQVFSARPVPDGISQQPNLEGTLAWVPGDQRWRNRRRVCTTQLFSAHRLDSLQYLRDRKLQQLVAHIRKHANAGTAVDLGEVAFATTLNLISNTIFSTDVVDPEYESAGEFKDLVWRIMQCGKPNVSDYIPALRKLDLQGMRRHVKHTYVRLHEIFDKLINKRLEARASASSPRAADLLDVLLDHCQGEGTDFTRDNIKPLILDLFVAGSDTSGITTEWAMSELLRDPEKMRKAQKELDQVVGVGAAVKESDIPRLPYLQAIIKETMRLHPAAPLLLPYLASSDTEIGEYAVQKGNQVLVNFWAMGRDPKWWDQPLSFRPERFLESHVDYRGRDFEYIPFGAGRRICPGLPLANRMVPLMLASIIHSFRWSLPPGTTPKNLDMREEFGITLKRAVPLFAVPTLRTGSSTN